MGNYLTTTTIEENDNDYEEEDEEETKGIPKSSELFIQHLHDNTSKVVIVNYIKDKEVYIEHAKELLLHRINENTNKIGINNNNNNNENTNKIDNDNKSNINVNNDIVEKRYIALEDLHMNIFADAFTSIDNLPSKNFIKENTYIEISTVQLEYLPKISMLDYIKHYNIFQQEKKILMNEHKSSILNFQQMYIKKTESLLLLSSSRYENISLDDTCNKLHKSEITNLFDDYQNNGIKATQQLRSSFITDLVKSHNHFISNFMWRQYTPEIRELYKTRELSVPFGYVGQHVKIVTPKNNINTTNDTYNKYILCNDLFYNVDYTLNQLKLIVIDNNIQNIEHYRLAQYKIFFWYYDKDQMQMIFGTYEFEWINQIYKFYLQQDNNNNNKGGIYYLIKYEIPLFEDFLFHILPPYAKNLVNQNLYIVL